MFLECHPGIQLDIVFDPRGLVPPVPRLIERADTFFNSVWGYIYCLLVERNVYLSRNNHLVDEKMSTHVEISKKSPKWTV